MKFILTIVNEIYILLDSIQFKYLHVYLLSDLSSDVTSSSSELLTGWVIRLSSITCFFFFFVITTLGGTEIIYKKYQWGLHNNC